MKKFVKKLRRAIFLIVLGFPLIIYSTSCINNMRNVGKKPEEMVILIHGMGRSPFSMIMMERYLQRQGYKTRSFSYSSTKYSVSELSAQFADFLVKTSQENPKKQIHIVSHSLGGILTREALVKLKNTKNSTPNPNEELKNAKKAPVSSFKFQAPIPPNHQINIGRVVMLAPPNKGSNAASFFSKFWPIRKCLKPIVELRNASDSPINDVPIPENVDIGVIAGKYDRKVTPEESHLKTEKDHITVNSAHSFIMNNRNVKIAVKNFLETGHFDKEGTTKN